MVIVWNTVYMAEVIAQLQSEGVVINDNDLKRLSPARRGHINPYGNYKFKIDESLLGKLRPLRNPT
jgi:hypothetical protein